MRDDLRTNRFPAYYREVRDGDVKGFVCVDYIESVEAAALIARVAASAMKLPEDARFTVTLVGHFDQVGQHKDFMAKAKALRPRAG